MSKIVVGQIVRNDDFWDREEVEEIWETINSGSHILLSAPRRVGKTSIMHKIIDVPKEGYIPLYIITESADNENDFWSKMFHALMAEEFVGTLTTKSKNLFESLKNIKIKKISIEGVEFGDGKVMNYYEAFKKLIEDLDNDNKLVIMIDEFAQTLENIIKYEDTRSAINLLITHRQLRQNQEISDKVTFLYAGSIGLESVVSKINASKHISDLNSVKISPLEFDDAKKFVAKLADNKFDIDEKQIEFLLKEIEWLIPFYIQLIAQEIKKIYKKRKTIITDDIINEAILNAIDHRHYFEHWQGKLKEALEKKLYLFAKDVLNIASTNMVISSNELSNLYDKHNLEEDDAKEIIHSLVYDGYINNDNDSKEYRFNSPILRMWWNKNVAN